MRSRPVTITLFGLGGLAALLALWSGPDATGERPRRVPEVAVSRATLQRTLVEPGTLRAARSVTIASEIRSNRAKIVSLLPDGTWVEPGDVVVRFDRTPFEDERARALGAVRDAEAAAMRATQERKLQIAKAEENLESARQSVRLARLSLDAFEKGSGALVVEEAEVRAADAGSELRRARADLADMRQMLARGFVSAEEVKRQRSKVEELERRSQLQGKRLRTAREVDFPRDLERARTQLQDSEESVTRAEGVLYYSRSYYQAAVDGAKRKLVSAKEALALVDAQLAKTELAAPIAGFLVLQRIPLESGKRRPQVGDSVWSGVPIATIPDLSAMLVTSHVREIDLQQVVRGQRASVHVEAYPDVELSGEVTQIGSLAEEREGAPWKFFSVTLGLGDADERLRPGMSVRVSFELESVDDVLVVPLDAIFRKGEESVVYVRQGPRVLESVVRLGLANETHVEVQSGVREAETLLLREPAQRTARREPPEADT